MCNSSDPFTSRGSLQDTGQLKAFTSNGVGTDFPVTEYRAMHVLTDNVIIIGVNSG